MRLTVIFTVCILAYCKQSKTGGSAGTGTQGDSYDVTHTTHDLLSIIHWL